MTSNQEKETIHKLWIDYHLKSSQTLSTTLLAIILAFFSAMGVSIYFSSSATFMQILLIIYASLAIIIDLKGITSARKNIQELEKLFGSRTTKK